MTDDQLAARIEALVVDEYFRDPPPFVAAMATAPTRGVAKAFVLEWTKFSRLFPRWVGAIMSNCPELDVLAFEVENLMTEVVRDPAANTNHYELLIRLGAALDLDRAHIEAHESCDEAQVAFGYWWSMARDPDWLRGFAAVNGLEVLGDRSLPARHGVRPATGLDVDPWARLELPDDALEFFRVSSEADVGHGNETVELLARHTPRGSEDDVVAVLRDTITKLRSMMDGLWTLAARLDGQEDRR
jgi:pyrroloquinoline quinone (PQQ) biosynthesis protein C